MKNILTKLSTKFKPTLAVTEDQSVRFGAAQTISRPRMNDMNASVNANFNNQPTNEDPNWTVNGGNTNLEPYEAINFDLTYENYFSAEGYFSIALYYKDLKNWIFDDNFEIDMTGVNDPATGQLPPEGSDPIGKFSSKRNGGEGSVQGAEFSVTLPFNFFTESLDGFGIIASHTMNSSDIGFKVMTLKFRVYQIVFKTSPSTMKTMVSKHVQVCVSAVTLKVKFTA